MQVDKNNNINDNDNNNDNNIVNDVPFWEKTSFKIGTCAFIGAGAMIAFVAKRFVIAAPTEVVVKTGLGIIGVNVSKKSLQLPLQRSFIVSMMPRTVHLSIAAKTKDFMPFNLPVEIVIRPDSTNLTTYVSRLAAMTDVNLRQLVVSSVEGIVRVQTGVLSLDEVFQDREAFKKVVEHHIQEVVSKYGIEVTSTNISDFGDTSETSFFKNMSRMKQAEALR